MATNVVVTVVLVTGGGSSERVNGRVASVDNSFFVYVQPQQRTFEVLHVWLLAHAQLVLSLAATLSTQFEVVSPACSTNIVKLTCI